MEAHQIGVRSDVDLVSFELRRNLINVLGEDHYPFGEYLYHELAANAYDEDASRVEIVESVTEPARRGLSTYDIVVTDDGNGMDREGLREWFRVGESNKRARRVSERIGRPLIGQIGVGKVSILKVARFWTIATERHLDRAEPVRLEVDVDVDRWIAGEVDTFGIRELAPTGQPGTTITLRGVQVRLRDDRILRLIQRLPLGPDFMVWRNGRPIPPRQWSGVAMIPVDESVEWVDDETTRQGPVTGEIWIRPEFPNRREQAFIEEPKSEQDAINRDPAGIEVRVNGDTIVREFFGHETYGHGVNRIWGWVEADWLPILGNRTDYLRDSSAGQAFAATMRPLFAQAYGRIRYENETRAQERRARREAAKAATRAGSGDGSSTAEADADAAATAEYSNDGEPKELDEQLASRFGESLNEFLSDRPELAPLLDVPAKRSRGRPANDRIYPIRPAGESVPFVADPYGQEIGIVEIQESVATRQAAPGSILRATPETQVEHAPVEVVERGERVVNTTAGVRLRFLPLGALEAPYRWNLKDPAELTLDINTQHKVYALAGRAGGSLHRLHCAWLVALALGERANPVGGRRLADYLETLSSELFQAWSAPRRSG